MKRFKYIGYHDIIVVNEQLWLLEKHLKQITIARLRAPRAIINAQS